MDSTNASSSSRPSITHLPTWSRPTSQSAASKPTAPLLPSWSTVRLPSSSGAEAEADAEAALSPSSAPSLSPLVIFPNLPSPTKLWPLAADAPDVDVPNIDSPMLSEGRRLDSFRLSSESPPGLDIRPKSKSSEKGAGRKKKLEPITMDISLLRLGVSKSLEDDDPILSLGACSSSEIGGAADGKKEEEGQEEIRGRNRSRLRIAGPRDDGLQLSKRALHAPHHLACIAPSSHPCPHGSNCPFSHSHRHAPPQGARISVTSTPAHESLPLRRSQPVLSTSRPASTSTPSRPTDDAAEEHTGFTERVPPTLSTQALSDPLLDYKGDRISGTRPPSSTVLSQAIPVSPATAEAPLSKPSSRRLDALGLPVHPLLPPANLSHHRGFRKTHRRGSGSGSVSSRSIESALEEGWEEEKGIIGKGRRSRRGSASSRGSLSGKYAVVEVPPYHPRLSQEENHHLAQEEARCKEKYSQAAIPQPSVSCVNQESQSLRTYSPEDALNVPSPLLPQSSATRDAPRLTEETSKAFRLEGPLPSVGSLKDPLDQKGKAENVNRAARSNFGMAIKALELNPQPFIVSPTPGKHASPNPQILPISAPQSQPSMHSRTVSGSSGDATMKEPASPTHSIPSSNSERSLDPVALFSGPAFTDPKRPLFSGYQHFAAPQLPPGHRATDWFKKQRDKDLRQANRLRKALEEKAAALRRKLEWQPPLVEGSGYGYGDGAAEAVEVKLESGEIMRPLSMAERELMERELEKVTSHLEDVNREISEHGGSSTGEIHILASPAQAKSDMNIRPATSRFGSPKATMHLQSPPTSVVVQPQPAPAAQQLIPTSLHSPPMPSLLQSLSSPPQGLEESLKAEQALGGTSRERVMARMAKFRQSKTFEESKNLSNSMFGNGIVRPEVVVRRSVNTFDGKETGLFDAKRSGSFLEVLNGGSKLQGEQTATGQNGLFGMMGPSLQQRDAINRAKLLDDAPLSQARQMPTVIVRKSKEPDLGALVSPVKTAASSAVNIDKPTNETQVQPSLQHSTSSQAADLSPALVSAPKSESIKQSRRISMSTAKPGEEASSQTMQGLSFDDSDDDADDSREYLSATEEGYETANEQAESDAQPVVEPPKPVENPAIPALTRRRSSTTTGLPLTSENKPRPSPLDNWSFNFSCRRQSKEPAFPPPFPTSISTTGLFSHEATPPGHSSRHSRMPSQESTESLSTPIFSHGFSAPNNTPSSPSLCDDHSSPKDDRRDDVAATSLPGFTKPSATLSFAAEQSTNSPEPSSQSPGLHPTHNEPYFVVKRSANTIDELGNVIQYATARVMSGGVKIGSIQHRGKDDIILEEGEDQEEDVSEETGHMNDLFVTSYPSTNTQNQTPPASSYPSGVPVPGDPHALSAPSPPAPQPVSLPSQPTLPAQPLSAPIPSVAPTVQAQSVISPTIAIQPHTSRGFSFPLNVARHQTNSSSLSSTGVTVPQPIEYCGDWRTTGHCRFGSRCRYSHNIEPRVKTSRNASSAVYRPSIPATTVPSAPAESFPSIPAGHKLLNVLPQPHHIPGVPLAQQPYSPFVYDTASSVAHPLTAPAATVAAAQGTLMNDKEKANKILKSLGLDPRHANPNVVPPQVLANGEIRYNLATRQAYDHTISSSKPTPTVLEHTPSREVGAIGYNGARDPPTRMASTGMSVDGDDDDIWTVSNSRRKRTSSKSESSRGTSGNARQTAESEVLYQSQTANKAFGPLHSPPSYSPVHRAHHSQHRSQAAIPSIRHASHHAITHPPSAPPATDPPAQSTLTQEEVFRLLGALGIGVPNVPSSVPPAYTSPQPPAPYGYQPPQHPGYYSGPYDYSQQYGQY